MAGYTPTTPADRAEMLEAIGVASIDELFEQIPEEVRLGRDLDLDRGRSESEVYDRLAGLAEANRLAESAPNFLGAGMYDHYVPAIVDAITQRSEFLTPYTPYQPEVSQGGLQVMFEFQTAMSELTGLPISNAGLYEGPSAAASAAYLAIAATGRSGLVASRGVHPHSRETLATHAAGFGARLTEVGLEDGLTDRRQLEQAIDEGTAAVFLQNPNFLGSVEDIATLGEYASARGALLVVAVDPMTLGVLRPPGECGADIAFGEGQPLGNRLDFGGPSFGFFCAREENMRRMPGRIAGETTDLDGRRGFVLTLQTREQHIRREKATSNICTAQALNALAALVHLCWLGRQGFVELGELLARRTAFARARLSAIEGLEPLHDAPVVREFAMRSSGRPVDRLLAAPDGAGPSLPVYPLGRDYPEFVDSFLVAITEQRSPDDIEWLATRLERAAA
ncbi:MAG: aminomethyl-transferring glycine dehydrogenase subunit GcvPA [Solirubrobacterales bacterium]|nr:aminomethyl-transferring glycine dehydrogenase subunit GcvPA [Solirubrobacterales bacterium]